MSGRLVLHRGRVTGGSECNRWDFVARLTAEVARLRARAGDHEGR